MNIFVHFFYPYMNPLPFKMAVFFIFIQLTEVKY